MYDSDNRLSASKASDHTGGVNLERTTVVDANSTLGRRRGKTIPKISMVVTCKGRLHHLKQTLPNMLLQRCPFEYEVIVVDYGCPQGTYEWCKKQRSHLLITARVKDNVEVFNLSRARNCGVSIATGEFLAFVDSDIFLSREWLDRAMPPVLLGRVGLSTCMHSKDCWDRSGTCIVTAELFNRVRGYDESVRGWAPEDSDFYKRCKSHAAETHYNAGLVVPIRHGEEERVQFYRDKVTSESWHANSHLLSHPWRAVNPWGYGRCKWDVWRGSGEYTGTPNWPEGSRRIRRAVRRVHSHV